MLYHSSMSVTNSLKHQVVSTYCVTKIHDDSRPVPETFGLKDFPLSDGTSIKNPLYSYTFQTAVYDNIGGDNPDYTKHVGYETVRYPLSGLGTPEAQAHNEAYPDPNKNWGFLNDNVKTWLSDSIFIGDKQRWTGIREKYHVCLDAPYYTVFSNTTSAAQYNEVRGTEL